MKKNKHFIFVLVFIILLSGCTNLSGNNENALTFYYYQPAEASAKDVMGAELYVPAETASDLHSILTAYLKGPQNTDLHLLFPKETKIVELIEEGELLTVTLSKHCSTMSQLDLAVSCSCLARTLLSATSATQICIQTEDGFINMEEPLIFTEDTIITQDTIHQHD